MTKLTIVSLTSEQQQAREDLRKARILGTFFAKLAASGGGVHPDLGHDDRTATQRTEAYKAPEKPSTTYPEWIAL